MIPWHERSKTIFTTKKAEPVVIETPVTDPHADLAYQAGSAYALAGYALSSFLDTAFDLDDAGRQQELIAQLAQERIDQLTEIRDAATGQAADNRNAARKIRELLGVDEHLDTIEAEVVSDVVSA